MINNLNRAQSIVDDGGKMVRRFQDWSQNVTRLQILVGTGTPEGNIEGIETQLFMDNTGTTNNILYIKRDADIDGDRSMGWILV